MNELLCIVGPTGVGKTDLAIEIAQKFNGELISADSRQIYIGMDIATGKEVEQGNWQKLRNRKSLVINGIPIFGLDLINPDRDFSAIEWLQAIYPVIQEIIANGKRPIIVGGTGFYLKALRGEIETLRDKQNATLRNELNLKTLVELQQQLVSIDEGKWKSLNASDKQNPRRLVRAIEKALHQDVHTPNNPALLLPKSYQLHLLGLTMNRADLYRKIDRRIEQMFASGIIEETKILLKQYNRNTPALTGIGYAEIIAYLDGELTLEQAIQKVKWRNHAYVRRQYTWFRKQNVHWADIGQPEPKLAAFEYVANLNKE